MAKAGVLRSQFVWIVATSSQGREELVKKRELTVCFRQTNTSHDRFVASFGPDSLASWNLGTRISGQLSCQASISARKRRLLPIHGIVRTKHGRLLRSLFLRPERPFPVGYSKRSCQISVVRYSLGNLLFAISTD